MAARILTSAALAAPGLGLWVAGLFHPHTLTPATADRWYAVHLGGLVLFPLVGVALVLLVSGRRDPLAWVVRVAAFGYAVFYTALDVVYGVAAGDVTRQQPPDYRRSADFGEMLRTAVDLGEVGSWSLVLCGLALTVDGVVRRHAAWAAAAALVPVGAWLVHRDHIFSPSGALGMALVGVATGLLWASRRDPARGRVGYPTSEPVTTR